MVHCILSWSEIAIHKDLSENDKIYHYYTMKNFIRLYKTRKMHLTHIYNWDDPWELPYRFINVKNINKNKDNDNGACTDTNTNTNTVNPFEDFSYVDFITTDANSILKNDSIPWLGEAGAICFTKNYDCDFMWKSFVNGCGVCIETKITDLIESIKNNVMRALYIAPIQYIDMEDNPKNILFCEERKYYPYTTWMGYVKRKNFEHENEIRMIIEPLYNREINDLSVDLDKYINKVILYPSINDKECDCPWEIHEEQRINGFRKDFPKLNCNIEISKIYRQKNINIDDFNSDDLKRLFETQSSYPKDRKTIYYVDENGNIIHFDKNGNRIK